MRAQGIVDITGVATPDAAGFRAIANALLDRAAALQTEAARIVGDVKWPLPGRISDQTGALVAAIMAEAARSIAAGVSVAAVYQYGVKEGSVSPRYAAGNADFEAIKARCETLQQAEMEAGALPKIHAAVGELFTEHGAWGRPGGPSADAAAALLRAIGGGGRGAEPQKRRRAPGFRIPSINDDDLPEV